MPTLETDLKVIVFQLIEKEYAIPVTHVRSIEKVQTITRVPNTPPYIKGVINLRGIVTPIIDLRIYFGFEEAPYSDLARLIIISAGDNEVGLIVDSANDVIDIPADSIEPPPEIVGGIETNYISGVAKIDDRLLMIIELQNILSAK
ncbi:chemotaxis protein CheW [Mesobacillus harenae]|uniref:chemotaxis protein CheW n=1 Tax=Mesobacillus harenae TaxID=2213203 RepID=UPI001581168B|nr:chemotaxis protein CheW [Mesobacillus harenae]